MKKLLFIIVALVFMASQSVAGSISSYADWATQGWTQIVDDNAIDGAITTPGGGGQAFDAEYLFVKKVGSTLFVGLQTGFDLEFGFQKYDSKMYYAGDLALSFNDSIEDGYEYAFDFGFNTKNYNGNDVGGQSDAAGLYESVIWNADNDIYFQDSNPFAMSSGTFVTGVNATNDWGSFGDSFYREISFDLAGIDLKGLDVHWTMSCGNDAIAGSAPVPEPATMLLLGSGLVGLAFYRRKIKK